MMADLAEVRRQKLLLLITGRGLKRANSEGCGTAVQALLGGGGS